jgi:hypothetical protein
MTVYNRLGAASLKVGRRIAPYRSGDCRDYDPADLIELEQNFDDADSGKPGFTIPG